MGVRQKLVLRGAKILPQNFGPGQAPIIEKSWRQSSNFLCWRPGWKPLYCHQWQTVLSDWKESKMAEKVVNYTPEQTLKLVQDYQAGTSVEQLAETLGKTVRSVVAKLSREGVYQKKTYVTKSGEPVQKKDQTADAIGAILRLSEGEIESLTKANKTALKKIFDALANSRPIW